MGHRMALVLCPVFATMTAVLSEIAPEVGLLGRHSDHGLNEPSTVYRDPG